MLCVCMIVALKCLIMKYSAFRALSCIGAAPCPEYEILSIA